MTDPIKNTKQNLPALPKDFFNTKINNQAIFDAIMSERASRRTGNHAVKTKAMVSGGGKKPFRQKGTGNARQGSTRSPQWVGGGVVWGPNPNRNYKLKVNKKVRKLAFTSALTLKAKEKAIVVHDFELDKKPRTKKILAQILDLKLKFKKQLKGKDKASLVEWNQNNGKILIVTKEEILWKSINNLPKVFATNLNNLSVEMIISADVIIFENNQLQKLREEK